MWFHFLSLAFQFVSDGSSQSFPELWFEVTVLEDPCLRSIQKFIFPENDPKGNSRITDTTVTFFPGSVYGHNPKGNSNYFPNPYDRQCSCWSSEMVKIPDRFLGSRHWSQFLNNIYSMFKSDLAWFQFYVHGVCVCVYATFPSSVVIYAHGEKYQLLK